MAQRIQDISCETQQLKAKTQSLRDICSKETERAQVPAPQRPPLSSRGTETDLILKCRFCCVQVLFDNLSTSMDEMNNRIDAHLVDLHNDLQTMSANF